MHTPPSGATLAAMPEVARLKTSFLHRVHACLLNKKKPAYFSLPSKTYSSIDLSIVSPSLFTGFQWEVVRNPYGSDHFPVIISTRKQNEYPAQLSRWKIDCADWDKFQNATLLKWEDMP